MSVNSVREDETNIEVSKVTTLLRLYRYMLAYKKEIGIVIFIMIINIGIIMMNPLIIEYAIDEKVANMDKKGLLLVGMFAIFMNGILVIGIKLRIYIMGKVSNDVVLTIRDELYTHLQSMSLHFFDSRPTGKILARVIGDVNSLKEILEDSVTSLIPELVTILSVAVIMVVKNARLAMAGFLTLPILFGGMYLIETFAHKKWQILRKKNSNLNAFIHENFSGIRIIQSFTAEKEAMQNFDELLEEQKTAYVSAVRLADTFSSLIDFSWALGSVLLYFIGIKVLGVGTIGVGTLLAFSAFMSMFWTPIRNISNFYNKLITNISGAERIFEVMDMEPEIQDSKDAVGLPDINGEIAFDKVTFSYEDGVKVLNNVSFLIHPGETIALVGATGGGKSTIVNLISRFYDIQEGSILIDGYPIIDVTIESLRRQMGVMTQDNYLFSGTIMENIRYGKLDATEEEIIAAAKAVHAHEFIMKLEQGYATEISERGARLSIGQRQLLAFARTMVSEPRILILDEATSHIDTHTEQFVQQGIEALLKGRTSFVIAHRLSTIQKADRIFVIDDGIILEEGNHESLIAKQGAYYNLYQTQS